MFNQAIKDLFRCAKDVFTRDEVKLGDKKYPVVLTDNTKEVKALSGNQAFVVVGGKLIRLFENMPVRGTRRDAIAAMIKESNDRGMVLIANMHDAVVVVGPETSIEDGVRFSKNNYRDAVDAVRSFFSSAPYAPKGPVGAPNPTSQPG